MKFDNLNKIRKNNLNTKKENDELRKRFTYSENIKIRQITLITIITIIKTVFFSSSVKLESLNGYLYAAKPDSLYCFTGSYKWFEYDSLSVSGSSIFELLSSLSAGTALPLVHEIIQKQQSTTDNIAKTFLNTGRYIDITFHK